MTAQVIPFQRYRLVSHPNAQTPILLTIMSARASIQRLGLCEVRS